MMIRPHTTSNSSNTPEAASHFPEIEVYPWTQHLVRSTNSCQLIPTDDPGPYMSKQDMIGRLELCLEPAGQPRNDIRLTKVAIVSHRYALRNMD